MSNFFARAENILKGIKWPVILVVIIVVFAFQFISIVNLSSTTSQLTERVTKLEADLATTTLISIKLAEQLSAEQNQSSSFQSAISDVMGTVSTLQKLSQTDKELLQKYSKVYFLSDNYVPLSLQNIEPRYLLDPTKTLQFHLLAIPFLKNMIDQAAYRNISLKVVSAYRSFGTQSTLKGSYLVTYGSGANQFSADQGYSEHQLGTAVDLTVAGQEPPLDLKFENTPAYEWLTLHAHEYGFILSYPKNNAFYQYEPWHWRFVGVALATKLYALDMNFADMEQRDIDTYLANIFD